MRRIDAEEADDTCALARAHCAASIGRAVGVDPGGLGPVILDALLAFGRECYFLGLSDRPTRPDPSRALEEPSEPRAPWDDEPTVRYPRPP